VTIHPSTLRPNLDLRPIVPETLTWYQSSDNVKRGFCARCGGIIFSQAQPEDVTYVTAGITGGAAGSMVSTKHADRDLAVRKHFDSLTADQHRRDASATVGCHAYCIANRTSRRP